MLISALVLMLLLLCLMAALMLWTIGKMDQLYREQKYDLQTELKKKETIISDLMNRLQSPDLSTYRQMSQISNPQTVTSTSPFKYTMVNDESEALRLAELNPHNPNVFDDEYLDSIADLNGNRP